MTYNSIVRVPFVIKICHINEQHASVSMFICPRTLSRADARAARYHVLNLLFLHNYSILVNIIKAFECAVVFYFLCLPFDAFFTCTDRESARARKRGGERERRGMEAFAL